MPTYNDETLLERYQREHRDYVRISEDDCMLDVDEAAWRRIVEKRGGCRCFLSAPCSACVEPVTEQELNSVGYTYEDPAPVVQRLPADDTEGCSE